MYAYCVHLFRYRPRAWRTRRLLRKLAKIQTRQGSRYAVQYFTHAVDVYPLETYNEPYYQDVLNYCVGLLLAHTGDIAEASDYMSKTGLLPAGSNGMLFSDHQRESLALYEKQQQAATRGLVSILITSLPKSGSASMTQSLAELLGVPIMRLSLGRRIPYYSLVQAWADRLKSGGMITHDHFAATPHNLDVLKKAGVTRLVVQVRDPRATMVSMMQMKADQYNNPKTLKALARAYKEVFLGHVAWVESWLQAKRNAPWLTIDWVHYRDFSAAPWETLAEIVAPYAESWPMRELHEKILRKEGALVQANFHTGNDDRWRSVIPEAMQKRMWNAMSAELIEFLGLKE